jgi:hypothetical protein
MNQCDSEQSSNRRRAGTRTSLERYNRASQLTRGVEQNGFTLGGSRGVKYTRARRCHFFKDATAQRIFSYSFSIQFCSDPLFLSSNLPSQRIDDKWYM